MVVLLAAVLGVAACGGTVRVSARAICEAAGGKYSAGTCEEIGPGPIRAEQMCEQQGGVFLAGEDTCALGGGVK